MATVLTDASGWYTPGMPKPFDITLKQLLAEFAPDWVGWIAPQFGLPRDVQVEPIDTDLSTVQLTADKVFRLCPPAVGLLHIEPQSSWDGALPDRLLLYNSHLHDRFGGPVYSTALLLRRDANSPNLTGVLSRSYPDGQEYLRFRYSVIRVWQLELAPLLEAGPGLYPLALLTDEAEPQLGELVDRLDKRMRADNLPDTTRAMIHTSSLLLLGMRYNWEVIQQAFMRIHAMSESTSYQAILAEGREEGLKLGVQAGRQEGRQEGLQAGRQEELHDLLTETLRERFGEVPMELGRQIESQSDRASLRAAIRQAMRAATLAEFSASFQRTSP